MSTQEIPRKEWSDFFDTFSRRHQGWLATLEIFGSEVGAQEEAHELPLEGLSVASEPDESEAIEISMGKAPDDHVSHAVEKPIRVWLEQSDEGADAALEIESEDQTKTLLRFRSPAPPELTEGVVQDEPESEI
ncbi:MAG TPA: DUF5335 family protein [Pyrinomonadaceae bacterium]|jgi:hypothetical protein|nr:DUF5335 family protein [Pyrinomonadaceae bacterium]